MTCPEKKGISEVEAVVATSGWHSKDTISAAINCRDNQLRMINNPVINLAHAL